VVEAKIKTVFSVTIGMVTVFFRKQILICHQRFSHSSTLKSIRMVDNGIFRFRHDDGH
jgi:7-keto-8-aminopelargonate synthetase-like enzyme